MAFSYSVEDITLKGRDAPPSDYLFQIQCFSQLLKALVKEYSSDEFEAGGYKWKLCLYPTGDQSRSGQDHISLYLELVEKRSFPGGWEVSVIFNLFVFNQLQNKYCSMQEGRVRHFHVTTTRLGIIKFIDLETFLNPSNGYLVDDTCVFGAEIFVVNTTFKGECLKMIREPVTNIESWKVHNFSRLPDQCHKSKSFIVGRHRWRILLYPNGASGARETHISLFLALDGRTFHSNTKLFVKFMLCIMDQVNGDHFVFQAERLFGPSVALTWGLKRFMTLAKLKDPRKGFLVNDTCVIASMVTVLGSVDSIL